ncbi:unnamed protein product [Camellia sinensis]
MGVEIMEIGVQIRKVVIYSIRTFYRSVCNHPFLVGLVFVLIFLHRSFPFLFSLLVSASPVLVCTAILLGTLLSFGQTNIPEIEKEEKTTTHEIASLKTGIQRDDTVVERDESFVVEKYTGKRRDVVEKPIEEASSAADMVSEVDKSDGDLVYGAPLIEENSREIQLEKPVIEEADRELHYSGLKTNAETIKEIVADREFFENQYSRIENVEDENVELQRDQSPIESIDSRMADRADSSPSSLWKREEEEEEEEVDDEGSDSGSDRAESSSPDASMTDIIPMLDELHPLLDEDAPQPTHMSHDGSDAGSERSQRSSNCTNDSNEDNENQDQEAGDDDDNEDDDNEDDDDEEEEETHGDKDDAVKSVITWTDDDQKNLMDLGTSELERNQRLESLIARRRVRRMMTEKNLIDLESSDLPFNITPVSTTRRNPFDLPFDSNDNMGLPPIPGSAPSIMLQRRNPFDLPYDSSEEKPNLMEDGFEQEFMPFAPKEVFFRRHESFNVGPSFFGPPKQEKQDIKFKPYFVPERMASEGTSYSSFQRQSSELSDSKVSSVPETDSICSVGDQDDKKLIEEEFSQAAELISDVDVEHPSELVGHGSESSEDVDVVGSAEDEDDTKLIEEDLSQEAEQISDTEHPAEHVGHGSESSENADSVELCQSEKIGTEHDELEMVSSISETRDVATHDEQGAGETHLNTGSDEVNYSSRSSLSSLSEVHERIFDEKEGEVLTSLEPKKENVIEESGISNQRSLEESDFNITIGLVDDSQHKEPVYDSSPPAVQKNLSSSSMSSDLPVESSEMGFAPELVKRTESFSDRKSDVGNQSKASDTPSNEQILADSSEVHPVDKNELVTSGISEKAEHIALNRGFSGDDQKLDGANASIVPEAVAEHVSIDLKPSSGAEAVEDRLIYQDGSYQHEQNQVPSLSFGTNIDVAVHQDLGQDLASSSEHTSSEDLSVTAPKEKQPSVVYEQVTGIHPVASSSENESIEEHTINEEGALRIKQDQVYSSSSDANFHVGIDQEANEEQLSTHSESVCEEKPMYELEEQPPLSDKAMVELSSENHEELRSEEQPIIHVESIVDSEVQPENKVSSNIYSSTVSGTGSPRSLSDLKDDYLAGVGNQDHIPVQPFNFPEEVIGSQVREQDMMEEADEIKEIDEGLLMELDAVGDFSVQELGSNLNEIENNRILGEEMNSEMLLVEAQSLEDIDSIFKKTEPVAIKTEVEIEIPHTGQIKEEINSGMAEFEAQSLEDSDKEIKKDVVEETKAECSEHGMSNEDSSLAETKMELPVVEARSIEDINLVFKQLHDNERSNSPSSVDDRRDVESKDPAETYSDLHVESQSEPSSVYDRLDVVESKDPEETSSNLVADVDLKPASEGNVDKPMKSDFKDGSEESESNEVGSTREIESSIKEPTVDKPVMSAFKDGSQESESNGVGSSKEIESSIKEPGVDNLMKSDLKDGLEESESNEVGSSKETESSIKEPSVDKLVKSDFKDGSEESESNEVGSAKEIESSIKEPSVPETSTNASTEQPDHGVQKFDDLNLSMSGDKGKKKKSHKSSSSSSSRSSSSDSE